MNRLIKTSLLAATMLSGLVSVVHAEDATLTIESWRNDDLAIWKDKIIPAFEAKHPGIKINFTPMAPTEYNAALNAKLASGTAGDLISCRPFDASLELYNKGFLTDLSSLDGMGNFSPVAKSAWQTDDAKATFCVPMASVIHGRAEGPMQIDAEARVARIGEDLAVSAEHH
jgi:raffinose/stachyose/melibiose transport system substrate-binding protein